jgi:hypothetical protein
MDNDNFYKFFESDDMGRLNAERVAVVCDNCGKTFQLLKSQLNRSSSDKHFCSRECFSRSSYKRESLLKSRRERKVYNSKNEIADKNWKPTLKCSFEEAQKRLHEKRIKEGKEVMLLSKNVEGTMSDLERKTTGTN